MRTARVYDDGRLAGRLDETPDGFVFTYDRGYLLEGPGISLTLPVRAEPYTAAELFPFFQGLLAEGSLRAIQHRVLRIDERDDFGLLLATGADAVGSVSVEAA